MAGTVVRTRKVISILLGRDGYYFWSEDPRPPGPGAVKAHLKRKTEGRRVAFPTDAPVAEKAAAVAAALTGLGGVHRVAVYPDSTRCVVVPAAALDVNGVAWNDLLAVGGIAPADDEEIVLLPAAEGIVAATLFERGLVDSVAQSVAQFALGGVEVASPLAVNSGWPAMFEVKPGDRYKLCAAVLLSGANAYITVDTNSGGNLKYCEALPWASPADILYYLAELGRDFRIDRIYLAGEGAAGCLTTIRKAFRNSVCV